MELLKFLESIRTPFFNTVFSLITKFGEEYLIVLAALFLVWCVDKKRGYYLFCVGFLGLVINQFLKIIARVPRPWIKDTSFTIVESAREGGAGYSFPSGHSQVSVGLYGGMARFCKNRFAKIVFLALAVLVPFSRLYLGVHTLADVLTSVVIATAMVFFLYPVVCNNFDDLKKMNIIFAAISGLVGIYVLYVTFYPFPKDIDNANLKDAISNGYKMFGAVLGMWLSYVIDKKYIKYDTCAVWWGQIIKFAVGAVIFIVLKSLLKEAFSYIFGECIIKEFLRYFILVIVGICIWPMTFRFYPKNSTEEPRV